MKSRCEGATRNDCVDLRTLSLSAGNNYYFFGVVVVVVAVVVVAITRCALFLIPIFCPVSRPLFLHLFPRGKYNWFLLSLIFISNSTRTTECFRWNGMERSQHGLAGCGREMISERGNKIYIDKMSQTGPSGWQVEYSASHCLNFKIKMNKSASQLGASVVCLWEREIAE